MDQKKLAQRLKAARLSQHITLRQIESLSEGAITNAYVSRIENGLISGVTPGKLRTLSHILKLDYMELMFLAGYVTIKDLKGKI